MFSRINYVILEIRSNHFESLCHKIIIVTDVITEAGTTLLSIVDKTILDHIRI